MPRFELPDSLTAAYGGGLGFARPLLVANFVSSVDGVAALPGAGESGHIVSMDSEADRFVMGLLRACADAVVIGAGTFRKANGHLWRAEEIFPAAAPAYAELRARLGLSPRPTLVVVTASGLIDTSQPAIGDATIVTTPAGAERLHGSTPAPPPGARVVVVEPAPIRLAGVVDLLHEQGSRLVLTEGGPSLLAQLVSQGLMDELFVTLSPALFGRFVNDGRKSIADGVDLAQTPLELLSARRHRSHLFLRYACAPRPERLRVGA